MTSMNARNGKEKLVNWVWSKCQMALGDLKGHLTETVLWIVVLWCIARRLELALMDAVSGTFFSTLDKLLMQVYIPCVREVARNM